jgi:biopolymer transport protein ExbB/TolQ
MLAGLRHALMSPVTGPIAIAVAFALAVALALASSSWDQQRRQYEQRIADLSAAADHSQASLRAELTACRAAGEQRRAAEEAVYAKRAPTPEGARRLLEQQPEGIDACARMESADQAVLSNLKK